MAEEGGIRTRLIDNCLFASHCLYPHLNPQGSKHSTRNSVAAISPFFVLSLQTSNVLVSSGPCYGVGGALLAARRWHH